jgi:hypothetical protein
LDVRNEQNWKGLVDHDNSDGTGLAVEVTTSFHLLAVVSSSCMPKQDEDLLRAALIGYQQQIADIETAMANIRSRLAGPGRQMPTTVEGGPKRRRKFSVAARKKMAASQKLRWSKVKQVAEPTQPAKPKRTMSASARKRIAAAQRKRWAEKKKAD